MISTIQMRALYMLRVMNDTKTSTYSYWIAYLRRVFALIKINIQQFRISSRPLARGWTNVIGTRSSIGVFYVL